MRNDVDDGLEVSRCLACGTVYEHPRLGPDGSPGIDAIMRFDTGVRAVRVGGVTVHQCRAE
jgi:hypothetical protein